MNISFALKYRYGERHFAIPCESRRTATDQRRQSIVS